MYMNLEAQAGQLMGKTSCFGSLESVYAVCPPTSQHLFSPLCY